MEATTRWLGKDERVKVHFEEVLLGKGGLPEAEIRLAQVLLCELHTGHKQPYSAQLRHIQTIEWLECVSETRKSLV